MITAERLQELIKQGATIWSDGFNEEIKLDPKNCRVIGILSCNGFNQYLEVKEDEKHCPKYRLENLREDVDRAKWEREMTAERTERFEPPMWEYLPIKWDFYFVKDKHMFHFGYENYNGDKRVIVSKCEYACEYGSDGYHVIYEKFGNATKENYIKACEIVRDLFNKGGAKC